MGDGRVKGWVTLAIVALVAAGCGGAGATDPSAGLNAVEATGRHDAAGSEPVTLSSTEDATPAPTVPTTAASPATTAPRGAAPVAPAPAPPVAPSVTIAALNDGGITESNVGDCSTISSQTHTLGQLQVTRSGAMDAPLVVHYSATGADADHVALPGVVTIPAGASSAVIGVEPTMGAPVAPFHEHRASTVTITLGPGAGYTAGAASSAAITLRFDVDIFGCATASPTR